MALVLVGLAAERGDRSVDLDPELIDLIDLIDAEYQAATELPWLQQ